jgi:hypothetical protein
LNHLQQRFATSIAGIGLGIAICLGGCASPAPLAGSTDEANANRAALACTLPSNCVNSLGGGALAPLRYTGTAAQGMALLMATLATFTEAKVVASDATALEAADRLSLALEPGAV